MRSRALPPLYRPEVVCYAAVHGPAPQGKLRNTRPGNPKRLPAAIIAGSSDSGQRFQAKKRRRSCWVSRESGWWKLRWVPACLWRRCSQVILENAICFGSRLCFRPECESCEPPIACSQALPTRRRLKVWRLWCGLHRRRLKTSCAGRRWSSCSWACRILETWEQSCVRRKHSEPPGPRPALPGAGHSRSSGAQGAARVRGIGAAPADSAWDSFGHPTGSASRVGSEAVCRGRGRESG